MYNNGTHSKTKHLWVKKATGLGVTEFMLRIMAWLCTSNNQNTRNSQQMCIVTGTNMWPWDKLYEWQYWPTDDLTMRPMPAKAPTKLEIKPS